MTNGYALPSASGLAEIGQRLSTLDESQRDVLRQALRIGLQLDTQVTHGQASQIVSQAYCSALPVACSRHSPLLWASFAVLVLGGGVFGNERAWIFAAVGRVLRLYPATGLNVAIVSYGSLNRGVRSFLAELA